MHNNPTLSDMLADSCSVAKYSLLARDGYIYKNAIWHQLQTDISNKNALKCKFFQDST